MFAFISLSPVEKLWNDFLFLHFVLFSCCSLAGMTCVPECTNGTFFNLEEMKCSPCHVSCSTCTGPVCWLCLVHADEISSCLLICNEQASDVSCVILGLIIGSELAVQHKLKCLPVWKSFTPGLMMYKVSSQCLGWKTVSQNMWSTSAKNFCACREWAVLLCWHAD